MAPAKPSEGKDEKKLPEGNGALKAPLPHPIQAYPEILIEIERKLKELDNGGENISEYRSGPPFMILQDKIFNVHQRILKLISNGIIEMPPVLAPKLAQPIQLLNTSFNLLSHGIEVAEEEKAKEEPDLIITLIEIKKLTFTYRIDKPLYGWQIYQLGERIFTINFKKPTYIDDNTFKVSLSNDPTKDGFSAYFTLYQNGLKGTDKIYVNIPIDCFTTIGAQCKYSAPCIFLVIEPATKESNYAIIEQVKGYENFKLICITHWKEKDEGTYIVPLENVSENGHIRYKITVPDDTWGGINIHYTYKNYPVHNSGGYYEDVLSKENGTIIFSNENPDIENALETGRITINTGEQISVQLNGNLLPELASDIADVKFQINVKSIENDYKISSEWLPLTSEKHTAILIDTRQTGIGVMRIITSRLIGTDTLSESEPEDMRESTEIYFPFGETNTFELPLYELIPYKEEDEEDGEFKPLK